MLTTYLGFALGAVNTLFLFTYFLSKSEYGLVGYVTSTATILSPVVAFGVHHTFIRFHSRYDDSGEQSRFHFMLLLLPLLTIIPMTFIGIVAYEALVRWLSRENEIVGEYVWLIFITAIAMAYFEIAYAWARVHLRTVAGNFLKEVFHRAGVMALLGMMYLEWIDFKQLMYGIFIVYFLRMVLMLASAFVVYRPVLRMGFPTDRFEILRYSLYILVSGSVASLMIDLDKFMINQYLPIGEIAVYNVAIFTATVIAIPYRAMYQIVSPLTAQYINQRKESDLHRLYHQSTVNIYLISVIIFILIVSNATQLYRLLSDESYAAGISVLMIVSVVKLSDALVGISNAILFNSVYYRTILYLGIGLVLAGIGLNSWLIPIFGINGAAIATLIAFLFYNILKIIVVYQKFKLHPFSPEVLRTSVFAVLMLLVFIGFDFSFHPLVNIVLKSFSILIISFLVIIYGRLSNDFLERFRKILKLKKGD